MLGRFRFLVSDEYDLFKKFTLQLFTERLRAKQSWNKLVNLKIKHNSVTNKKCKEII